MRQRWPRYAAVCLLALLAPWLLDRAFPPPLARAQAPGSMLVLASDGTPLRAYADDNGVWRYRVALDDVAHNYLEALLHYEDRWFHYHAGVNPVALLRAVGQALRHRRVISGGSTLTMQVARLLEPIPRTVPGKIKQMLRAMQLEARLGKREILQIYVNLAPFGGAIEGVQAASHAYLGKSAFQLSDAEAALLVVLPQAPSRWRPDRHPEAAQRARDKVLERMVALAVWPPERAADARIEQVAARRLRAPMRAALLAERLRRQVPDAAIVSSTIDVALQERIEARVDALRRRLPERNSLAVMVVESASMQVLAYVGSAHLLDRDGAGHVDMVQAARSPGSTLKPLLYGMALDQGLIHSMSLMIDAPQAFDGYRPGNFMERFQGPVSATQALRLSLNVPAVDLLERYGVIRFSANLEHAGLRLRMPAGATPNLSLILGGAATTLEELVGSYAALARDGRAARPRLRPDDALVERHLMSPEAAWIVRRMLEREPRDSYASQIFDSASRVSLAWKTGTSYGFRDSWALALTPDHIIGVWIGRPDGTPQPGQYGAITALPLLVEVADGLPTRRLRDHTPMPQGVTEVAICWPLGTAASDQSAAHCHRRHEAYVIGNTVPPTWPDRGSGNWRGRILQYWRDRDSGNRLNLTCFNANAELHSVARWPALAYPWLSTRIRRLSAITALAPGCQPDELSAGLIISGLNDGVVLRNPSNRRGSIRHGVQAIGSDGVVRWLLNQVWIGETRADGRIELEFKQDGDYRLIALDEAGHHASVQIRVRGVDGD